MKAIKEICEESKVDLAPTRSIVERVGKKRVTVTVMLTRMRQAGQVENPLGWGSWKLTEQGLEDLAEFG
jgi:hypothetical protein